MSAPLLFDELLDGLRREGFSVGTDQYLRMHALLEGHAGASPDQLKSLLCPIFAMSAAEQERFHVAYDEFFATRSVPKTTFSRRLTVIGQTLPGMATPRKASRWKRHLAIVMSIIAVIVAVLSLWPHSPVPAPVPAPTPMSDPPVPAPVRDPPLDPFRNPAPRSQWLLIAGSFAFALFAAEVARTLLRWLRQREHGAQGRPFDWPVRDLHPTAPRLFADQRFFAIARLMKGREVGEVRRLDVPRSILATIRALGDPVFEYKLDRRVTEYLFLVERRSERDHLAAYVHAMVEALARDGALVEVFEHDGDPRHCWKPGTSVRVVTADLHSRFPQHRLVIVGNVVALTNPVTGEALDSIPRHFPWNYRALLTTEEETRGVGLFGAYFDVYALANKGLARLAERWQQTDGPAARRRPEERRRIVTDLPSTPEELERELDPLIFRWLLRCAVHPTLHWDLTRELAPPLPAAEHEAALLGLVRLEWFRRGRIPERERLALVSRLSDDEPEESAARASAMRVLAAAPPPPPGSVAARVFEIQQLAHKIWTARDRPAELRPLLRKLRHYPPAQVGRDGALMMLLHEAPGTLVTHSLPQPLRRFLFRDGIPAFGMRNFVALAAVLPVMLFAGNAMRPVPQAYPQIHPKEQITVPQAERSKTPDPPLTKTDTGTTIATETATATDPSSTLVADRAQAPVVTLKPRRDPEPPTPVPLPDLPKLIAPAAGSVITIDDRKDVATFTWEPAGSYTLQVFDSQGTLVHVAKVRGTSAAWRVTSGSSGNTWSLMTSDGRVTDRIPFDVEAEILIPEESVARNYRTVSITLPVSCGTTEGKRDVDLQLSPREIFESAELKVLNSEAFEVAELSPRDGGSFSYRFVAAKPCRENTLEAKIRVTATLRLTLPTGVKN
ncbi:MAG TPA: hypothetical protein VEK57_22570 [Thermoanaerobaculia bacterium]|nr:hypothetical protein [Thermoanaerobaculia bacterium]